VGFFIVLGVIVVGALFAIVAGTVHSRGPVTPMHYLGSPAGAQEQELWMGALQSAGIHAHILNPKSPILWSSDWRLNFASQPEVWVPEKDYEGARAVLGWGRHEGEHRTRNVRLKRRR